MSGISRVLERGARIAGATAIAWLAARTCLRSLRTIDLRGRVVVITGGSRGLGLTLARQCVREGARVAICGRGADDLERGASQLRSLGGAVASQVCDVGDPQQVSEFVAHVRDAFGHIDVLINNAGMIQVGPLETMTLNDFEDALATHYWGPVHMVQATLPEMRRRHSGRIVNIVSIGGEIAVPHLVPYCASKFALAGFSRGLRTSLARENVFVTTVFPGLMRTGSHLQAEFKGRHREEFAWFSILGALPIASTDAETAARKILRGCREGRAEVHFSVPERIVPALATLCPELAAELTSMADRLLPSPGGIDTSSARGIESQSAWSPSWLTTLSDKAARRNNEVGGNGTHTQFGTN
ncbi:MAG: SDR family oxidoreductase [Planctomyces sp.]|nr:SDR family oxidoreductase [Planctomyces sp.]